MQTVSRDIPGLMTSRDTVLCRLNVVHGIIVNFADRISPPKPYRNVRSITCKKFVWNISLVVAREITTEESLLHSIQRLVHIFFLRDFISLYALTICQRLLRL